MNESELSQFFLAVREMRESQKRFFADRTKANLDKAREHEKNVDALIEKYTARIQPKLF